MTVLFVIYQSIYKKLCVAVTSHRVVRGRGPATDRWSPEAKVSEAPFVMPRMTQ